MESQSKYYGAVDGLRAVAVGLVLLYHAGFGFARGGFIGVDVFFVISGFLITGLIARDVEASSWSFRKFYVRRIARLTPALLATLLATLVAGYFILTPDDLARLGRTGMYAAVSVSNFFFWQEAGYFDQTATSKPFLHTWSLGVEEQFYLIWPAIIFLLIRWRAQSGAAIGLALLGLISLAAAAVFTQKYPDAVFFLMPFRVHQFALGGLIALLFTLRADRKRDLTGLLGLIILFAVAFSGDEDDAYWLMAFLPAVAAALFIWSSEAPFIKTLFSSMPLKWLGQRSYSIYLVHWPIMVLWPMATDFHFSTTDGLIAIGVSILAGAILHRTVERPFRFKRDVSPLQRGRSVFVTVALLISCTFVGSHYWALNGMPERVPKELQKYSSLKEQWAERIIEVRSGVCSFANDKSSRKYRNENCASPPGGKPAYMIIGDSYGAGASMMLRRTYREVYFGQFTMPGCQIGAPNALVDQPKRPWCKRFYKRAFKIARQNGFDGVVITAAWGADRSKTARGLIRWAERNDLDLVLFSDRPRFRERVPVIISSSMSQEQAQLRADKAENIAFEKRAYDMETEFENQTKVVNMHKVMCDEQCPIFNEKGELLYLDASHMSVDGAKWFGARLRTRYPDLFQ